MAVLDILHFPDPRLRHQAQPVERVTVEVQRLADDMLETMYHAGGIGLAATQVDVNRRVVVIDLSEEKNEPRVLINPEILERIGENEREEGCLSVPGTYEKVTRAEIVRYRALDRAGNLVEEEITGLMAVCLQHEIDHLDGKLFVDYLSNLKRLLIRKRLEKSRERS